MLLVAEVQLAPAAYADLQDGVAYYEALHPGLGQDFLTNFETTVEGIERLPEVATVIEAGLLWVRPHLLLYK